MKNRLKSLSKRFLSLLTTTAIVSTMMVALIPTANAAAATSVITAATFNSAGLAECTDNMLVTFTEPVCGDADCTEGLSVSNFSFTNGNAIGFASISSVTHTAGNDWALLTMNTVSVAGDTSDTIGVEEVYTPSGMLKEDSALTTALTADTTAPTVSVKRLKEGADDLLLQFSEPVQDEQCTSASLASGDFTYADAGADTLVSISTATSTLDRDWVFLTGNAVYAAATDSAETLAPTDNKVYDMVGNEWVEAATALSTFTDDSTVPAISSAYGRIGEDTTGGNDLVFVNFSEPVFSAATNSGALVAADFVHSTASTPTTFTHSAGSTFGIMDLNANQTAMGTVDTETAVGGNDDVYDVFGNALLSATAAVTITDNTFPTLRGVWVNQFIDHASSTPTAIGGGTATALRVTNEATIAYPTEGSKMFGWVDGAVVIGTDGFMGSDTNVDLYDTTNDLYEFTQVKFDLYYEDADGAVGLVGTDDLVFVLNDAADFTTASEWATTAVSEKTWTTITIDLTSAVSSGTALASQVANPQYFGIKTVAATSSVATSDGLYIDNVRFSRGASSKSNQVTLEYSEAVDLTGDPAVGASGASTATSANMTTSKTLAGMGAFASGTLTTKTLTNTLAKSADGTTYTTTLANRSGGLITSASPVTLSGLFTPTASVTDIATNAIAIGSTHTPETVIDTLDLTTAATAPTDFRPTLTSGDSIRLGWTAPSQTAATFSHYALTYGTSAGVTVASTLWDESTDATLATATTATSTITSLVNGTLYYFNLAAVDAKGIPTTLLTEKSALPSAGSSTETVAPAIPTGIKATVNADGKVVLTWTDPADTDLNYVMIAKSTGKDVDPATILSNVAAGLKTYTDTAVSIGDVVNYKLSAVDTHNNASAYSAVVSLTVKVGETAAVTPATPATPAEPATPADEPAEPATPADEPAEPATPGETPKFKDAAKVPEWAKAATDALVAKGIIKGNGEGMINPAGNLNRADTAMLICRMMAVDEKMVVPAAAFTDMKTDAYYNSCVHQLKGLKIVKGKGGTDKYEPGNETNRAEFFALAFRAYGIMNLEGQELIDYNAAMEAKDQPTYKDIKAADWFYGISAMAKAKGFNGIAGEFAGAKSITRAEAFVILDKLFK